MTQETRIYINKDNDGALTYVGTDLIESAKNARENKITPLGVKVISKDRLLTQGDQEIEPGVYIQTQDDIILDSEDWADEDPSKDIDFAEYKFWVTTDDGCTPEGFDTICDAIRHIYQ